MNPAKIDIHLHLDGSLNLLWAYNKAIKYKTINEYMTFEDFYNLLFGYGNNDGKGYTATGFEKYDIVCSTLQTYDDLFEATYLLAKTLNDRGLIYAEIRLATQQHCLKGLSQLEALQATVDGAKKAMEDFPIKIGIINCMMHKGNSAAVNESENLETIKVTKQLLGSGAVALDLAGYENNCDFNEYAHLFEIAQSEGIPYTIHAAEMGNGENILKALKLKPSRIGHGINCIQKPEYLKAVVDSGVTLEVCVSSNIGSSLNYVGHPIRDLIKAGVKVTINTDNMIFDRTDLLNEYSQMAMIGISNKQLQQCTLNSLNAAFIDDDLRSELRAKLEF